MPLPNDLTNSDNENGKSVQIRHSQRIRKKGKQNENKPNPDPPINKDNLTASAETPNKSDMNMDKETSPKPDNAVEDAVTVPREEQHQPEPVEEQAQPPPVAKLPQPAKVTGSIKPKVQTRMPVYTKKKIDCVLSPRSNKPESKNHTRAVCVLGLRCGTQLAWIEQNGKPAYVWPMLSRCKDDPNGARQNWKIDLAMVKRDPKDMNKIQEFMTTKRSSLGEAKRTLQNLFIRFPEGDSEKGPEFRNKWGHLIAKVYNWPEHQTKLYGANTLAYFAGDLTPRNHGTNLPYLSDYLTIKHTIDALEFAYNEKTREEIVGDDLLLGYYFPVKKLPEVRESENGRRPSHSYMADQDMPTFDSM